MKRLAAIGIAVALLLPVGASAAPFGGQASVVIPCFNGAILAFVGAPRGGPFLWTPATLTYRFGPPSPGAYVLGLSGIPYFCLVSVVPIIVTPGLSIMMMGSSR